MEKEEVKQEPSIIRVSVRNLVEFILREGDIDNRVGGKSDQEAMLLGSRLHRKIQNSMTGDYQAEVPLKINIPCDRFTIVVEGRADGIIGREEDITIDEIKGMFANIHSLEQPIGIHLAQAKCYGYIYGLQNNLSQIKIQMTYCNLETEEIKRFVEPYTMEELTLWFQELMDQYQKWANWQFDWREQRNSSIKSLEFPFSYRPGQKELVVSVYRTILRKKKLFIQAPTGVGKTLSTIFPSIKAVGEGKVERLFYLTARTITRTAPEQAIELLREQGLDFRVLTITAKEKMCPLEVAECNPAHCPYAKGHYDRINDAVYDLITTRQDLSREILLEQAEKFRVCPFEMSLDASLWSDGVICDYNYVFDPKVYLRRFFQEGVKGEYLFLIDEAHNLVDRGREMYSATLWKQDFVSIKKLLKETKIGTSQTGWPEEKKIRTLGKRLERCNKILLEWKRECETYLLVEQIGGLLLALLSLMSELEEFLEKSSYPSEAMKKILDFYFQVRHFLNISELLDENYVVYGENDRERGFKIKLFCVQTGENLNRCMERGVSTILFSATLLPIQYYKELLSKTGGEDYAVYANTSFPKKNRLILVATDVSSKYNRRNETEYTRIAAYIHSMVKAKKGNYLVFFPSYQFLEEVSSILQEGDLEQVEYLSQNMSMSERDRETFLNSFWENRDKSLIGLCVMGGIFSEGIDLKHESLIGTVIVGTGLPGICYERDILKEYYDERNGSGFDYAYRIPGMNKVLQSSGRVIRTNSDRGVILLLDERFREYSYKALFPREWDTLEYCTKDTVGERLNNFWEEEDNGY